MTIQAPLIDRRSHADLVVQIRQLLLAYADVDSSTDSEAEVVVGGAFNGLPQDVGNALVHIFARMSELVIERVNKIPEKNFLAFLDLIGLDLKPPQAARVPLTFNLIASSTEDAIVPAGTKVSVQASEGEIAVFETESELVATRSRLTDVYCRNPGLDRYRNNTSVALSHSNANEFSVFESDTAIPHVLYFSQPVDFSVNETKNIRLFLELGSSNAGWLHKLRWQHRDGDQWSALPFSGDPQITTSEGVWQISFRNVAPLARSDVNGVSGFWLRAVLDIPLEPLLALPGTASAAGQYPRVKPSALAIQDRILPTNDVVLPFGQIQQEQENAFYLAADLAFAKPGANIQVGINLVQDLITDNYSGDLTLLWEYWNGAVWQKMGDSWPNGDLPAIPSFIDDTRALTRSGTVSFIVPVDWQANSIAQNLHHWLRLSVQHGHYLLPPEIGSIDIDSSWAMPQVDTIQAQTQIENNDGVLPDRVFSNQIVLDASKTFYPFGERPKLGDTFYLQCNRAFNEKPEASISVRIEFDSLVARPSANINLQWQYWDGVTQSWQRLVVQDTTANLVNSGDIRFVRPASMQANTVNGQEGYWLRVYLSKGDYGRDAHYTSGNVLVAETYRAPIIQRIVLNYRYTSKRSEITEVLSENDFIFRDFRDPHAQKIGLPFYSPVDLDPTFYLGFQREGDDRGFDNTLNSLHFTVADVFYDASLSQATGAEDNAALAWEYWNGASWVALGVEDETQSLNRRGMIHFIGPEDFRVSEQFGTAAFWMRARWQSGNYARLPKLHGVVTNTVWAENSLTSENEILGSSNGQPNQVFYSVKSPVLQGQTLEVREPERPIAQEWSQLMEEEGEDVVQTESDVNGNILGISVRWHHVTDFYQSGPRSRHYLLDRISGEVRFGDGQRGLIPPVGRGNIQLTRYQSGGGPAGNRPANTITQLKSAIALVASVTNLAASAGGAEQETLDSVKQRGPKSLRHRNRAVTINDYEDLVFEASTNVARVKCIAAKEDDRAGRVGLVIVPLSVEARPIPSLELLRRVEDNIRRQLPPTVDIWVSGPQWLEVNVEVEIVPIILSEASNAKSDVRAQLASFLHPLKGGVDGQGWAFGRKPHLSDIYAAVERVVSVDHVRRLIVHEQGDVDPEHFLIFSGEHQITLLGQNTGRSRPRKTNIERGLS